MRYATSIWLAALVFALPANAPAADAETTQAAAEKTLAEHQLVASGDAWLCREEVDVRRWLEAIEPMERQYQVLRAAVDERVRTNETAGRDLVKKRKERADLRKRLAANTTIVLGPTREQLEKSVEQLDAQIKKLRAQHDRPEELAARDAVRDEVVRLANAKAALTLAAAGLRRQLAAMPKRYEELAADENVKAALTALGANHRLGTDKDYSADAALRLARLDRIIQVGAVPIYRDDDHVRLVAIVGGSTPATFSLRNSDGPTHIPHSLAASLNLSLENAPTVDYLAAPNRKLVCRKVKLATIQVGSAVFEDVAALVLPPEGEDLGAKLGRAAYKDHYFDVDFGKLRLTIFSGERPPAVSEPGKLPAVKMRRPLPARRK